MRIHHVLHRRAPERVDRPLAVLLLAIAFGTVPHASVRLVWISAALIVVCTETAHAQERDAARTLDSLVARAIVVHPQIAVAEARAAAARARIGPAGSRPDPMLMAGLQNFPVSDPGFADFMTMKMVGVEQVFPYRGKRALRTAVARTDARAAELSLEADRRQIARQVREAYYDVVEARLVLENLARQQSLLSDLVPAADVQYASGDGDLRKALIVRQEAAAIAVEAASARENERAALARLNSALDQPSDADLSAAAAFPFRVLRAAGADAGGGGVAPATLGDRIPDSPLLPLDSIQHLAVSHNAMLQAHEATIDAQRADVALAQRAHLPDIGLSVGYAHRSGFTDMVTATVSVPLPVQRGRVQNQQVAEARAELLAREAEHHAVGTAIRAEVARLVAELESQRTQLALLNSVVLPLDRATVDVTVAAFRAGRADLSSVLSGYGALFRTETKTVQAIARVGRTLAMLEEMTGMEVLR